MKKFSITLFAILLFNLFQVKAQDKPDALVKGESASVSENLVKVETLYPNLLGVSYEKKLTNNTSLYSMVGLLGFYGGGSTAQSLYGANPYYILMPQITVQPRFYHNLSKRAASDKNIKFNAANYVGLSARFYDEGVFITNTENHPKGLAVFDLMLSYGFQRTFFKRVNWDMSIQPGIEFYDGQAGFFIGFNLQLGAVIFSN